MKQTSVNTDHPVYKKKKFTVKVAEHKTLRVWSIWPGEVQIAKSGQRRVWPDLKIWPDFGQGRGRIRNLVQP